MIHNIFQRHHIPPDEIYNKPRRIKHFMYASMEIQIEEEEKQAKKANKKRTKYK